MKQPVNVAITGKIGAGKTTVCRLLRKEGFQVFESDKEINKLFRKKKVNALKDGLLILIEIVKYIFDKKTKHN